MSLHNDDNFSLKKAKYEFLQEIGIMPSKGEGNIKKASKVKKVKAPKNNK